MNIGFNGIMQDFDRATHLLWIGECEGCEPFPIGKLTILNLRSQLHEEKNRINGCLGHREFPPKKKTNFITENSITF
jgi:hypothetical protein